MIIVFVIHNKILLLLKMKLHFWLTNGNRYLRIRVCLLFVFVKVKSNYFIVRPKVDLRAGLLSLPHLGNFHRTHVHHICLYFVSIHQRATPVLNSVHF